MSPAEIHPLRTWYQAQLRGRSSGKPCRVEPGRSCHHVSTVGVVQADSLVNELDQVRKDPWVVDEVEERPTKSWKPVELGVSGLLIEVIEPLLV